MRQVCKETIRWRCLASLSTPPTTYMFLSNSTLRKTKPAVVHCSDRGRHYPDAVTPSTLALILRCLLSSFPSATAKHPPIIRTEPRPLQRGRDDTVSSRRWLRPQGR